jgi:hypothetical protein
MSALVAVGYLTGAATPVAAASDTMRVAIGSGGTGVATTTRLTAPPAPASAGAAIPLTAKVEAAGGIHPNGSVQFEAGGTSIGSPVPVDANGVAATTTTVASAGSEPLSAVFTPSDPAAFTASAGPLTLTVNAAAADSGDVPVAVILPTTGAFTLTSDTADTVSLAVSASGLSAGSATTPITASDTRNTFPGWSVAGQVTNWTGSGPATGATISGNQLGWTPTSTGGLPKGVSLGSAVDPANPGLGATPAVLASVHSGVGDGFGTAILGADLSLLIPATQEAGPYSAELTISAVDAEP